MLFDSMIKLPLTNSINSSIVASIYRSVLFVILTGTLWGCTTLDRPSATEQSQQISTAKESNLDHQVPTTFEEAVKNPGNLGVYSPLGISTSMTSNNTGLQTTQNTPTLATPFIALQNAPLDTRSKNGISSELQKLMKEKKWDEALQLIEKEAKKNPRNVQILFVRTRILVEQGKLENARQALVAFIDKYPEIPEPYNNLAVLYASAGKLEQARDYLELCLKLAPNYAIALQNLGDIYTLIAASNYDKAFKQNRRMTEADRKRKLAEAITAK
jgi:Flp pilus assembly protein TadD